MSRTFGGATSNNVNFVLPLTIGGTTRMALVAGWWYPTTLTAGRGYWGCGGTVGAEIGATTSEIVLRTQNATTSGVWTTSGAGIVTNEWVFLAFFGTFLNSGSRWRIWKGSIDTAPVQVGGLATPTTAPSGNLTGQSTIALGNRGTGTTVSWIGDIGNVTVLQQGGSVASIPGPMGISSNYGTITVAEEDQLQNLYVRPIWSGNYFPESAFDSSYAGGSNNWCVTHFPMDAFSGGTTFNPLIYSSGLQSPLANASISAAQSLLRTPVSRMGFRNVTREFIAPRW